MLQERFTTLMQEKVDLKERVEELEHRCIQLSGETDTIGETAEEHQAHDTCCTALILLSTYAIPIELIIYTVIRNIHLVYQFKHKRQNPTVYSQFKALYYYTKTK